MKKMNYLQGAFILMFANSITGILAFIYRIYLSRSIGAEGVGVYQLVMPIYVFFVNLVSGGIVTALSRLIAEQNLQNNHRNMYKVVKVSVTMLAVWSAFLSVGIFFNAEFISKSILKDERTLLSILIFTPALMFIAMAAVLKGYFYGLQQVKPPAVIDIFEKVIRLSILMPITILLLPYGIAIVCAGAMTAMAMGELISFLLLYWSYRRRMIIPNRILKTESSAVIAGKVLKIAFPLSINGFLQTSLDMILAVIVPALLIQSGLNNKEALSAYGEMMGMVFPLLFFPFIIVVSLCTTLVPAITTSFASKNWAALNKKCNDALKITSVVAFAATMLFLVFPNELCRIFFNCPQAGNLLYWVSFSCIFQYWQLTLFSIMNGMGQQVKVLGTSILGMLVTLATSYYFLPKPEVGAYGYIAAVSASAVLITLCCISILKLNRNLRFNFIDNLLKPATCFLFSIVVVFTINQYLSGYAMIKYNMTVSAFIGFVLYFILLVLSGTFTMKQIKGIIRL